MERTKRESRNIEDRSGGKSEEQPSAILGALCVSALKHYDYSNQSWQEYKKSRRRGVRRELAENCECVETVEVGLLDKLPTSPKGVPSGRLLTSFFYEPFRNIHGPIPQ
jgi:hypothetical protein